MEPEDLIKLASSSNSGSDGERVDLDDPKCVTSNDESVPRKIEGQEDNSQEEILENVVGRIEIKGSHLLPDVVDGLNVAESTSMLQVSLKVSEFDTIREVEMEDCFNPAVPTENGLLTAQDEISSSSHEVQVKSGVKRSRLTVEGQQTSVHVVYSSLTRDSKRKLEELLKQWSEWHAKHCSSYNESDEVLESGEETFFPAIKVGQEKPSAVSFWVDKQAHNLHLKDCIPFDGKTVPLYDRGYSLALTLADGSNNNLARGLDIVDAPRCFNCGSYSHSLKECPRPRDLLAVNSARKQHKSKRNQHTTSRNSSRYYENSPGGKFDGLRPGVLDAETRKCLGLRELDPPPWLNRMREIGYPPGYLDIEDDDQPSGITIIADEDGKVETEEGEILDTALPRQSNRKCVKFPGINAPIPHKADERRWAAASSSHDPPSSRSHQRYDRSPEYRSRVHRHERRCLSEYEGPPGVDPQTYYQRYHAYESSNHRYGEYESGFTSYRSRGDAYFTKCPSPWRSSDRDRGWRSPFSS